MREPKYTTRQLLEGRYPSGEYILMQEVSDASGFRNRSLDYMVAAIWQSRGLSITGIEKKSNRSDWLKELKNPQKQEAHFKYCDYFYILTDREGVAKMEEIPETWGWLHCTESRIREMKKAPKLNPTPVCRSFLMCMLRRAADKKGFIHVDNVEATVESRIEREIQRKQIEGKNAISELAKLREVVEQFEKASGIDIQKGWYHYWEGNNPEKVGNIVRLLLTNGADEIETRLLRLKSHAEAIVESLAHHLEEIQIDKQIVVENEQS